MTPKPISERELILMSIKYLNKKGITTSYDNIKVQLEWNLTGNVLWEAGTLMESMVKDKSIIAVKPRGRPRLYLTYRLPNLKEQIKAQRGL